MRPVLSILTASAIMAFSTVAKADTFSESFNLVARTTMAAIDIPLGCSCDDDCKGNTVCDPVHKICVQKDAQPTNTICTTTLSPVMKDLPTLTTTTTAPCTTSSLPTLAPTSRTTMADLLGCTCDDDCKGRFSGPTTCEHNICVEVKAVSSSTTSCSTSVTIAPTHPRPMPPPPPSSAKVLPTTKPACTCDADCAANQTCNMGVCKNKIAPTQPPVPPPAPAPKPACTCDANCGVSQTCVSGTCKDKIAPTQPPIPPPAPASKPACTCDADCGVNQICVNGMCKDKLAPTQPPVPPPAPAPKPACTCDTDCGVNQTCVNGMCKDKVAPIQPTTLCSSPSVTIKPIQPTIPCSTPKSVIILPTSKLGCDCDSDCAAGEVCQHNICVKVAPIMPPSSCSSTPSVTILPTYRTTATPECTCDADCRAGYYCDMGCCMKSSLEPTNRSTSCTTTPTTFTVHPIVVSSSSFITKPAIVTPTTSTTALPTFTANAAVRNDVRWGAAGVAGLVVVLLA